MLSIFYNTAMYLYHIVYCTTLRLKVDFHRVDFHVYNQTFDFVTGQFVKILSPTCL